MKKVLSMILTVVLVMALSSGTAFANNGNGNDKVKMKEFKDMKGHWGSQSVEKMQSLGILDGYADGTFQPDNVLTQGELAVIIARMLDARGIEDFDDEVTVEEEDLSDVPSWAKDAVSKGFHKNYLNMKRFHSKVQCDRLTAVVAIAKALDLAPVTDFTSNPFKDRSLISDEDYGYLLALYEAGYINGYPDGNFNPNNFLSRAQIASIIAKLLNDEEVVSDDETAPTWDSNSIITASAIGATSVKLTWSAADDEVAVVGYKVSYEVNDVEKVKYVTSRTATITGLEAVEDYTFAVEAKDAAGNWSNDGPSVNVITLEDTASDTTVPTWTSGAALTISSSESGIVTIIWPDAVDNVAVTAYKIYKDGQLVETMNQDSNSLNVTGLNADTEYIFKVRGVDAAGNLSASLSKTYLTD